MTTTAQSTPTVEDLAIRGAALYRRLLDAAELLDGIADEYHELNWRASELAQANKPPDVDFRVADAFSHGVYEDVGLTPGLDLGISPRDELVELGGVEPSPERPPLEYWQRDRWAFWLHERTTTETDPDAA